MEKMERWVLVNIALGGSGSGVKVTPPTDEAGDKDNKDEAREVARLEDAGRCRLWLWL
jgi:hypothetical protein